MEKTEYLKSWQYTLPENPWYWDGMQDWWFLSIQSNTVIIMDSQNLVIAICALPTWVMSSPVMCFFWALQMLCWAKPHASVRPGISLPLQFNYGSQPGGRGTFSLKHLIMDIICSYSGLMPVIKYVNSKGFKFGLVSCWNAQWHEHFWQRATTLPRTKWSLLACVAIVTQCVLIIL